MRGATCVVMTETHAVRFQSTHPMRGATCRLSARDTLSQISIHAPHARCDQIGRFFSIAFWYFNPRTPCEVRRQLNHYGCRLQLFQSTHPMRGATLSAIYLQIAPQHFNPRTPCEVRLTSSDLPKLPPPFQSTHPMRGATRPLAGEPQAVKISIHAPHARCDPIPTANKGRSSLNFNPRTPCEVRPKNPRR